MRKRTSTQFARPALALVSAAVFTLCAATAALAAGVPGQGTWETTLLGRDASGHAVAASSDAAVFFYDTELNVTWLRDANLTGSPMVWTTAMDWAQGLRLGDHGQFAGWRLPTVVDPGAASCDFSYGGGTDCGFNVRTKIGSTVYSEMAHLWYDTLGNKTICAPGSFDCSQTQSGWGLTNSGDFKNYSQYQYWSNIGLDPSNAWMFETVYGGQSYSWKGNGFYAMAVRPGDVLSPVPEPQAFVLMLLGIGFVVVRRRSKGT